MEDVSKRTKKHAFSIDLKSKEHVKHVAMSNDSEDKVLIEGFLGELEEVSFIEGAMLEIKGINGTLRMDLREEELRRLLECGQKRCMQE